MRRARALREGSLGHGRDQMQVTRDKLALDGYVNGAAPGCVCARLRRCPSNGRVGISLKHDILKNLTRATVSVAGGVTYSDIDPVSLVAVATLQTDHALTVRHGLSGSATSTVFVTTLGVISCEF